jgi:hypothetical protein
MVVHIPGPGSPSWRDPTTAGAASWEASRAAEAATRDAG